MTGPAEPDPQESPDEPGGESAGGAGQGGAGSSGEGELPDDPFGPGVPDELAGAPEEPGRPAAGSGFGFGASSGPGAGPAGAPGAPDNPFAALFGGLGGLGGVPGAGTAGPGGFPGMPAGVGPADLGAVFEQLGRFLQHEGGPVNWELAQETARQTVVAAGDRSVSRPDAEAVRQAVHLAELWLDEVTELPATSTEAQAWSAAEWIEATLPVWRQLCDPVATRVVGAMGQALPAEMAQLGPLGGILQQMGGAVFGAQFGQALGSLATEVVGASDVGLPLTTDGRPALLPAGVAAFGQGLGVPLDQVRLYLALREAASQRLYTHVPWLRAHLLGIVDAYARGITVDTSRIEEAVRDLDPANPEALQEALSGGLFEPETTPAQRDALARLETALALVEGWVDHVVAAAAAQHLPAATALRESVRRRRASGGPAEQTFAALVGLELRPRRLREAAALWTAVTEQRGAQGREALWGHPDLLPGADDLDDPQAFARGGDDLDLSALDEQAGHPGDDPDDRGDPDHPRP